MEFREIIVRRKFLLQTLVYVWTDVSGVFALATRSAAEINSLLMEMSASNDRLNDTTGQFHGQSVVVVD